MLIKMCLLMTKWVDVPAIQTSKQRQIYDKYYHEILLKASTISPSSYLSVNIRKLENCMQFNALRPPRKELKCMILWCLWKFCGEQWSIYFGHSIVVLFAIVFIRQWALLKHFDGVWTWRLKGLLNLACSLISKRGSAYSLG